MEKIALESSTISSCPMESPIEYGISAKILPAETLCSPLILISSITHVEEIDSPEKVRSISNNILCRLIFTN